MTGRDPELTAGVALKNSLYEVRVYDAIASNLDAGNAYHRILRQVAEVGHGPPRQGQRLNRDAPDANGDQQPSLR